MRSYAGIGFSPRGSLTVSAIDAMRRRESAALAPSPEPFDPLTLTPMQQAALLQMHESQVKRALIRELLQDSQDKPSTADYRALADMGLCNRNPGKRYHDLTAEGREATRTLQQSLCKRFDIHLMLGPVGSGSDVRFSCPCGWTQSFRNSHTAPGNARASWNRHVSTAEGMNNLVAAMKPPGMRAEGL